MRSAAATGECHRRQQRARLPLAPFPKELLGNPEYIAARPRGVQQDLQVLPWQGRLPRQGAQAQSPARYTPEFVYDRVTMTGFFRGMASFKEQFSRPGALRPSRCSS